MRSSEGVFNIDVLDLVKAQTNKLLKNGQLSELKSQFFQTEVKLGLRANYNIFDRRRLLHRSIHRRNRF